jgi:hypothetical protein
VSDFVLFYFSPFSIMMFNIHTGHNVRQVSNEEILIMVSCFRRFAQLLRLPYLCSLGT